MKNLNSSPKLFFFFKLYDRVIEYLIPISGMQMKLKSLVVGGKNPFETKQYELG